MKVLVHGRILFVKLPRQAMGHRIVGRHTMRDGLRCRVQNVAGDVVNHSVNLTIGGVLWKHVRMAPNTRRHSREADLCKRDTGRPRRKHCEKKTGRGSEAGATAGNAAAHANHPAQGRQVNGDVVGWPTPRHRVRPPNQRNAHYGPTSFRA